MGLRANSHRHLEEAMNHIIVGMLAETFVHPGSGQNAGAIDLPVAREAATGYPFIAGSSLKGALRYAAEQTWGKDGQNLKDVFGLQENAGNLLVGDARLLLLPVRSLSSAYKWVTCPHLLERFKRDLGRGSSQADFKVPTVDKKHALAKASGKLFLEERSFTVTSSVPSDIISEVEMLIAHEDASKRLAEQIVIVHDDDFNWFAKFGLAIQARNQLTGGKTSSPWKNPETGKTERGNLWYEETLPPDTLMYSVLAERNGDALEAVKTLFNGKPYLQVGGNETVGQGWFALEFLNRAAQ